MKNQSLKPVMQEMVREELRKGSLIKTKDILEMLPEVVDAVQINKAEMRAAFEGCLATGNPINAIFKLFGLQLIKKEKTIDSLVNSGYAEVVSVEEAEDVLPSWMMVSASEFQTVMESVAQKLAELENRTQQELDAAQARGDSLFDKHEKLTKVHNTLKAQMDANEKLIAERIQYMLFVNGAAESDTNKQLIEMLDDLGIEVYWDSTDAPFAAAAMFAELRVDDASAIGTKPCLARNGEVYIKGLRLVQV